MIPSNIKLHRRRRTLELEYSLNGHATTFEVSAECLRVHSPSAEVRGHGKDQAVLQIGKRDVGLLSIEAAGNYGLRLTFDDTHDSGIFTWDYLHQLATEQETLMLNYERQLHQAGQSRDDGVQIVNIMPSKPH